MPTPKVTCKLTIYSNREHRRRDATIYPINHSRWDSKCIKSSIISFHNVNLQSAPRRSPDFVVVTKDFNVRPRSLKKKQPLKPPVPGDLLGCIEKQIDLMSSGVKSTQRESVRTWFKVLDTSMFKPSSLEESSPSEQPMSD